MTRQTCIDRKAHLRAIACVLIVLTVYNLIILSSHSHLSDHHAGVLGSSCSPYQPDAAIIANGERPERCPECELIAFEGCKIHAPSVQYIFQSHAAGAVLLQPVTQCKILLAIHYDSRAPPSSN